MINVENTSKLNSSQQKGLVFYFLVIIPLGIAIAMLGSKYHLLHIIEYFLDTYSGWLMLSFAVCAFIYLSIFNRKTVE